MLYAMRTAHAHRHTPARPQHKRQSSAYSNIHALVLVVGVGSFSQALTLIPIVFVLNQILLVGMIIYCIRMRS